MFVSVHIINSLERAKSVGVSAAKLATVCGIGPTQLSNATRGLKNLGGETELRLATVTLLLTELQEAISPLRLPDNVNDLQKLLGHVEDKKITAAEIREHLNKIFGQLT